MNYSHRFFGTAIYSVSGEVPAVFNLDEDLDSGNVVPKDYKQIFVTPAVRVNLFPSTAVSPWVSLGGGFGHFSQSKNLLFYGRIPEALRPPGCSKVVLDWMLIPSSIVFTASVSASTCATSGPAIRIFPWLRPARAASIITL